MDSQTMGSQTMGSEDISKNKMKKFNRWKDKRVDSYQMATKRKHSELCSQSNHNWMRINRKMESIHQLSNSFDMN